MRIKVLIFILSTVIGYAANAMDSDNHGNHSSLKAWFDALRSDKGPCCSVADGYTITDADWESDGTHYRVRVPRLKPGPDPANPDMVWIDVPDDAVIHEPNLYGRTVVWPIWNGYRPHIRCFIVGSMT